MKRRLIRLGCPVGQKDRNTGDAIREVVKRYLSEKGRPAEDIKVIDSVIAELKDDNERGCAASCVRGEHWEEDRCVANATSETGPDKRAGAKAGARQPNGWVETMDAETKRVRAPWVDVRSATGVSGDQ